MPGNRELGQLILAECGSVAQYKSGNANAPQQDPRNAGRQTEPDAQA
jgi:hypothetical protein